VSTHEEELQALVDVWDATGPYDESGSTHAWLQDLLVNRERLQRARLYYQGMATYRDIWDRTERWIAAWQTQQGSTPEERARHLRDQGFMSVSNKFRTVARCPPGLSPLEAIRRKNPELAQQEQERFERHLRELYARMLADGEDHRILSDEEFLSFKRVGQEWTERRVQLEQDLINQRRVVEEARLARIRSDQ
jgi:hypothetical protein